MAVPKRKTTPSKGGMRRSHDKYNLIQVGKCDNCGAIKQSHCACATCGFYNGRQVLKPKTKGAKDETVEETL